MRRGLRVCQFVSVCAMAALALGPSDGAAEAVTARVVIGFGGATPTSLFDFHGTLFFVVDDGTSGAELWKSDGTSAGTVLVKDIAPGATGSSPSGFQIAFGRLFFTADDGVDGREFWTSDGTAAGTTMFADVAPGAAGSSPSRLVRMNGLYSSNDFMLFAADDGVHGRELWKTDGTAAGTALVKDIAPGPASSSPDSMIDQLYSILETYEPNLTGLVYFAADDGVSGRELWRTDGTEAGTKLVMDVRPGPEGSSPEQLSTIDGSPVFYFTADDGVHGRELWAEWGGPQAARIARDIVHGPGSTSPAPLTVVGEHVFFVVDETDGVELWTADADGVRSVKDIWPGNTGSYPQFLTEVRGELWFSADDGHVGRELWKTNGREEGTTRIADVGYESSFTPVSSDPHAITPLGNTRFTVFAASDGGLGNGVEPWVTDGTEAGTHIVEDLVPGAGSSDPSQFTVSGVQLFFTAKDAAGAVALYVLPIASLGARPTEFDSDDDRFPDEVEIELGSSPGDATSTPEGVSSDGSSSDGRLTRLAIRLDFASGDNDTISIAGTGRVPAGFVATGKRAFVDVGGAVREFTLDSSGTGRTNDGDVFRLKLPRRGRAGVFKFSASFAPSDLTFTLDDEGLVAATGRSDRSVFAYVFVEGLGAPASGDKSIRWVARPRRAGTSRLR